jgi:hypothetical protein
MHRESKEIESRGDKDAFVPGFKEPSHASH